MKSNSLILQFASVVSLIFSSTVFSQGFVFQREVDTIPVSINGSSVHSPFSGGLRGSKPVFADIDNDGDLDLFVGLVDGNIRFYRNNGTASTPLFHFETNDFAPFYVGNGSNPTFADIDNDGDLDLFEGGKDTSATGVSGGKIKFYRNTGTPESPVFTPETESFSDIDVGKSSAPVFVDIDNDGDLDLFVGERDGNVNYYKNEGTDSKAVFTLQTEEFASINVGFNSVLSFADIDNDGDFDLFVGESDGNINSYTNIGSADNPNFILSKEDFASIDVGDLSAPSLIDIDDDGDFDLFVGESEDGISFYRNTGFLTSAFFTFETSSFASLDIGEISFPAFGDIDDDGDLDLFIGESAGNLNFYRNAGTEAEPLYSFETETFASITDRRGIFSTPSLADIDNDGDLDLFVGDFDGDIAFYRNTGTSSSPTFILETGSLDQIDVGEVSYPAFVDIDNDGDLDLFVGESNLISGDPGGNINFYRNSGTRTDPIFVLETENFAAIDFGRFSFPHFVDVDKDGDFDFH